MKKILVQTSILILICNSCSSISRNYGPPPSANRLEVLKKTLNNGDLEVYPQDETEEFAASYLSALKAEKSGNTQLACKIFDNLSKEKAFALYETALIHALANCDYSEKKLTQIWKKSQVAGYLKEMYTEQSLKIAANKKMAAYEARFSLDLIPFKKIQSDKIMLIKRALQIAMDLNDQDKIFAYTQRLKEISPLLESDITDKNIYSVAKDFENNRDFKNARLLYKKIIEGNFTIEEKIKSYNSYRLSFKVERDLVQFISATSDMTLFLKNLIESSPENTKTLEYFIDSQIVLSKAIWTDHRSDEARKFLEEIINSNRGSQNQLATAHMIIGSILLENKKNNEALLFFKKAINFKITDTSLLENIQWALVWNSYLLKKGSTVVDYADKFIRNSNNRAFISKVEFWKAMAYRQLNRQSEAEVILKKILDTDQFGYYGILSSIYLKVPLKPLRANYQVSTLNEFPILGWLIAMDEIKLSENYLKEINSQFKTFAERERLMPLYSQTKWFQGGMRQIYNFKEASRDSMTAKYIDIIFPTPYYEIISELSTKYKVPTELIYSIIRQESSFVPSERSWADAFGLMQMIPEKATTLSAKYNIHYNNFNDLYNPEINLQMGTALLSELIINSNFKFIKTIASYNASENAINTWEKDRFTGDYLEFIENIPYEETRNYVKTVFRNFITYKRIMTKKEFIISKDFFAKSFLSSEE